MDHRWQVQCLAAYECFEGGLFNAAHGWYRLAVVAIRNAIEDILVGLYYENRPGHRAEFDAVTTGKQRTPGRGEIDAELLKYASRRLVNEINMLYNDELSIRRQLLAPPTGRLETRVNALNLAIAQPSTKL